MNDIGFILGNGHNKCKQSCCDSAKMSGFQEYLLSN